jgi:hypothetical protein
MKTKIMIFVLILRMFSLIGFAQNIVSNPSFEQYTICPDGNNEVPYCIGWYNFGKSPDYSNSCSSIIGPPYNMGTGFQYAHTGIGMVGLITYQWQFGPDWPNYREFVGTQLSFPLVIGQKYYMSFFVNCAGYLPGWQIIGANKTGLRFSTIPYGEFSPPVPTNWAHLYTDSIITDTVNWIRISGSIIADSAYQYLVIGNFFDDNHTDIVIFGGPPFGGSCTYYYIDDVCVSTDSIYNEQWTGIKETTSNQESILIYPNPATGQINFEIADNSLEKIIIIDNIGRQVFEKTIFQNSPHFKLDISFLPSGLYNTIFEFNSYTKTKKIIISEP